MDSLRSRKLAGHGASPEEHWYAMWGLIFGSGSTPTSPYAELPKEKNTHDFHEHHVVTGQSDAITRSEPLTAYHSHTRLEAWRAKDHRPSNIDQAPHLPSEDYLGSTSPTISSGPVELTITTGEVSEDSVRRKRRFNEANIDELFSNKPSKRPRRCAARKLSRIRDVKQHLKRSHTIMENHCQRCFQEFPDLISLQRHESLPRSRACACRYPSKPDGISPDKSSRLSRKSDPSLSEEQQWYAIWDIVFADKKRPCSVYMSPITSDDLEAFYEHLNSRAGPLIQQTLETAGVLKTHAATETRQIQELIGEAVYDLQREWFSNKNSVESAPHISGDVMARAESTVDSTETPATSQSDLYERGLVSQFEDQPWPNSVSDIFDFDVDFDAFGCDSVFFEGIST
ncbi:hypothetical protein CCUS01_02136 [Colletotrichum cuscutae]|uniref:C2H2-type domain-containing protein n=1 Tax=Colletotrichum cuscutae TaxID=1209917 RepID=A0AAI9U5B2_9PEZI|nr:hypothetical protein CCUS01_02136 [Colletotrichum cuscutae]